MSTTFDLFPSKNFTPSYRELLGVATEHLHHFLHGYEIKTAVTLSVGLRTNDDESRVLPIDIDRPCW